MLHPSHLVSMRQLDDLNIQLKILSPNPTCWYTHSKRLRGVSWQHYSNRRPWLLWTVETRHPSGRDPCSMRGPFSPEMDLWDSRLSYYVPCMAGGRSGWSRDRNAPSRLRGQWHGAPLSRLWEFLVSKDHRANWSVWRLDWWQPEALVDHEPFHRGPCFLTQRWSWNRCGSGR